MRKNKYLIVESFMAGQTMKKWNVVTLDGEYVRLCKAWDLPLGIIKEDCYMGEIVEIVLFGVNGD